MTCQRTMKNLFMTPGHFAGIGATRVAAKKNALHADTAALATEPMMEIQAAWNAIASNG